MEDGVDGVPTWLVHERVEEEYSGEQELAQIQGIPEKNHLTCWIRLLLFVQFSVNSFLEYSLWYTNATTKLLSCHGNYI